MWRYISLQSPGDFCAVPAFSQQKFFFSYTTLDKDSGTKQNIILNYKKKVKKYEAKNRRIKREKYGGR
jgi:hypothetical protein